jgi:NAD(P)-dependent dehydrogenase (short-subunit alcohol dehydrogenase family)
VKALVTGGEGGLGRAMCARLRTEGYQVESLDLRTGFDVADPAAWERVEPVDVACLNAGILTGELSYDNYRRSVRVNVDGVVLGALRMMEVMEQGVIVVTASLAGLTAMPSDPVYALTKHALVGFVRSVAPLLEPLRINAVCPGIADTAMIAGERESLVAAGFPLLAPDEVAEAMWRAVMSAGTGECWFVQPGREPAPFRFPNLPGPRRGDERVGAPPLADRKGA